jgi:low temperature requirement protein LtrA
MTLADATARSGRAALLVVLGAPILFLLGNVAFKQALIGRLPLSHLVGLGLMLVVAVWAPGQSLLALDLATSGVLIVVAVWERRSYHHADAR